jgi:hypothetical protein
VPEEANEADRGRIQGGRGGFGSRTGEDVAVEDEDDEIKEEGLDAAKDLEGPIGRRGRG